MKGLDPASVPGAAPDLPVERAPNVSGQVSQTHYTPSDVTIG